MACRLTSVATIRHFSAPIGSEVTVRIKTNSAGADIVNIRYAGSEAVRVAPFEFKVQAGTNLLVVLVRSPIHGARLQFIEADEGGAEQLLDEYDFDALTPARVYTIHGV